MRWPTIAVWIVSLGCGRVDFDPRADGGPPQSPPVTCWDAWLSGAPVVSAPAIVAELATVADETNPVLAADGRTLYFSRDVDTTRDIFAATRTMRGTPFVSGGRVSVSQPNIDDGRFSISDDGTVGVVSSTGLGTHDLWLVERSDASMAFGPRSVTPFTAVNTGNSESDPAISSDGLRVYYSVGLPGTDNVLRSTSRPDRAAAFEAPQVIPGIPANLDLADPALSPDERVLLLSLETAGAHDLYFAVRSDPAAAFGALGLVPNVNDTASDADATLSADGCELLFSSTRGGNSDVYVATIDPG